MGLKKSILQSQKAGSRHDVAARYGIPEGTLANLAWQKRGPRFYKKGRKAIYFFDDVEQWLRSSPVQTIDLCGDVG